MPKKKALLAVFLSFFVIPSSFALSGIGVQIGTNLGDPLFGFASATVKSDAIPWVFSLDCDFKHLYFQANGDNCFVDKYIAYPLSVYLFWGISASIQTKEDFLLATGSRAGIGLSVFSPKSRFIEGYIQASWNPSIGIEYDDYFKFLFRPLCFPCSAGIRFWLKKGNKKET